MLPARVCALTLMPTSRLIEDFPVMVVLLMIDDVIVERLKNELDPVLLIELFRFAYGDDDDDISELAIEDELNAK